MNIDTAVSIVSRRRLEIPVGISRVDPVAVRLPSLCVTQRVSRD